MSHNFSKTSSSSLSSKQKTENKPGVRLDNIFHYLALEELTEPEDEKPEVVEHSKPIPKKLYHNKQQITPRSDASKGQQGTLDSMFTSNTNSKLNHRQSYPSFLPPKPPLTINKLKNNKTRKE